MRARPDNRESAASADLRVTMLLANATDAALGRLTPRELVNTHRGLSLKEAEYRLVIARQKRGLA